jgi:hypothetical protein
VAVFTPFHQFLWSMIRKSTPHGHCFNFAKSLDFSRILWKIVFLWQILSSDKALNTHDWDNYYFITKLLKIIFYVLKIGHILLRLHHCRWINMEVLQRTFYVHFTKTLECLILCSLNIFKKFANGCLLIETQ